MPAFTVAARDRIRDRIVAMARADRRIVAGAIIGSLTDGGDRWSDLDLTFGLAPGVTAAEVLADWSATLEREAGAVQLFDLPFLSTVYRVFLFPGGLQVDVSLTPGAEFGALGPKFTLLFGEAVERPFPPKPSAAHTFGLAVHHAVRGRIAIERGRRWQAEYWISALRDYALTLACLRLGLEASYGRGFDDLPAARLEAARRAVVRAIDDAELMRALGAAVDLLLAESAVVADRSSKVDRELRGLTAVDWPGRTVGAPPTDAR